MISGLALRMAGERLGLGSCSTGEAVRRLVRAKSTADSLTHARPYGMSVPYEKLFERFTTILKSHDGRPHWAKQHDLSRERLVSSYPKFEKFCEVRDKWDPANRWACEYGERHFGKAAEGLGLDYK